MQETFDVMHINKFVRGAVGLVKGTELKQIEDSFEIAVLSGILWFRVPTATNLLHVLLHYLHSMTAYPCHPLATNPCSLTWSFLHNVRVIIDLDNAMAGTCHWF